MSRVEGIGMLSVKGPPLSSPSLPTSSLLYQPPFPFLLHQGSSEFSSNKRSRPGPQVCSIRREVGG
eukprot:2971101-Rhodomonas_salina.3